MKKVSLREFQDQVRAQGMKREYVAVICPACNTVQTAQDLINAGAGISYEDVEKYLGFSCVGRFTGAGSPNKNSGKPCNWTLGGLFQIHEMVVVTEDGEEHPFFELATPEQAKSHFEKLS
jgi:hypothetical protein